MMYIIAGIAAIIIFTFMVICIVICLLKKKARFGSETSNEALNPETISKRESIYTGFSIDNFDMDKINQFNYYNSLRHSKSNVEDKKVMERIEGKEDKESSIQRNLDYFTPDLTAYQPHKSSLPDPDPTYARPLPKAQRPRATQPYSSASPITISERTSSSPASSSEEHQSHTYDFISDPTPGSGASSTSNEPIYRSILKKVPPPTLPKSVPPPALDLPPDLVTVLDLLPPLSPSETPPPSDQASLDRRVRSCTQV